MDVANDLRQQRLEKLALLRQHRIEPYGGRFEKPRFISQIREAFQPDAPVRVAGRLVARRRHGRILFGDLRDQSGTIQIWLRPEHLGDEAFDRFNELLDIGDLVGVEGTLCTTKTGEITISVQALTILAKSLRPLPEKWHGLKDVEARYRHRHLDLVANPEVARSFLQRSRLLRAVREFLDGRGFIEVETPVLQPMAGGAAGEPFVTHHEALEAQLYLRLAPELYLKRLLVGGFERVYEIGKSFRNEGLSPRHNPEFTMLELYQAYADCETMMALTEALVVDAAERLGLGTAITYRGRAIDLTPPWERRSFAEQMERLFGIRPGEPLEAWRRKLEQGKFTVALSEASQQQGRLTRSALSSLVEEVIGPSEAEGRPVFVTDFFTEFSPLARSRPGRPELAERFELFIGGMEIANAYSELNDPLEQRRRFERQAADDPAKRVDEAFLEALEYGMPPAGGLGIGMDRLAMLLTGQASIKDVILFPQLRSETDRDVGRGTWDVGREAAGEG